GHGVSDVGVHPMLQCERVRVWRSGVEAVQCRRCDPVRSRLGDGATDLGDWGELLVITDYKEPLGGMQTQRRYSYSRKQAGFVDYYGCEAGHPGHQLSYGIGGSHIADRRKRGGDHDP